MCLQCGAEWTELDVLSLYSEEGFECQSCGAILQPTEDVRGEDGLDRTGHEKNSKLMAQLDSIMTLLKQIDATDIPMNDFDYAWDHKIDVVRDQQTHPTKPTIAVAARQPAAVRGNTRTDATAIEISLQSSAEKSAAEQAAEAARKATVEKQNALPVWHTHSTVSTSAGTAGQVKTETGVDVKAEIKDEEEAKPTIDALDDIAAYYAEIAKAKAEEASSAEDDSEDDDEFEDVGDMSGTGSAAGTPAATVMSGGLGPTSVPGSSTSGIKRELESESGSSAPQTVTGTPTTPADDGPAAKKVKTEEAVKEEESDEDDEEFEDAI